MERLKTAVIYDPYLDTLGGGERYSLTVADILSTLGWKVLLAWDNPDILKAARKRFSLNLHNISINLEYFRLFSQKTNLIARHKALKGLDLTFVVSDGSIPILFGDQTILHYQIPFTKINQFSLVNKLKLFSIKHIVVNSQFTKKVIDKTLGITRSKILYPPVDVDAFKNKVKKEKIILNVGRFTSPSHSKRQDVLISSFKTLYDQGLKDWKLILAGGKFGQDSNLEDLKKLALGYHIDFVTNPDFAELKELYAKASLYWHAAGFEVDEVINPEAVEHFGITTVEAMSAGCVPLVINKGGQKEIVGPDVGYLWDNPNQLIEQTKLLTNNPAKLNRLALASVQLAGKFSIQSFRKQLISLIA